MTKIVICGAGFGGLTAALALEKQFRKRKDISITLIDKHAYHVFNPNLYEVATAEEELTSVVELERSIALPIEELLSGKRIEFIQAEVSFIDGRNRRVTAGIRQIEYDYLIVALGSRSEFFGIEGAEKYGLPLKTVTDALHVRNALEFAVESRRQEIVKPYVRFVIAGGGYTGVELAAEMSNLANVLAWKNNYPRQKIEISIVEASNGLLPGFSEDANREIMARLSELGVTVKLLSRIAKVDSRLVYLADGQALPHDVLVWTTGVRAQTLGVNMLWNRNSRGQFETDEFLRVCGQTRVFVIGDMSLVKNGAVPATAQAAVAQAAYLAKNFPLWLRNKKPKPFRPSSNIFIVEVGGAWCVCGFGRHYFVGRLPYLLRLGANVRYFSSLVGWWKALRYVLFQAELYGRND